MKRWAEKWSSFPAAHKKRGLQGFGAYLLVAGLTAGWVGFSAADAVKDWDARTPSATAEIKNVYLTPQIAGSETPSASTTAPTDTSAPVVDDGRTYVSVIVSGLGLSALATERALNDLPPQISLAFSPYSADVQKWIGKAIAAHHETLIQMPMEAANYPVDDPGPKALSSRFSDADNTDNLNWMLAAGQGSAGAINMMGSRFLNDKKRLPPVFNALRKNNVMFVEALHGAPYSAAAGIAAGIGLPYMSANLEIDSVASDRDIRNQLDALEQQAHKNGYAVGLAQPYPLTLNILKSWASGLEARGITLAPIKTIWKNKPHHDAAPQTALTPTPQAAPQAATPVTTQQPPPVVQSSTEHPPADPLKQPAK